MKYKEINLNKKLFGDDFIVYDWKETADKITVYVKATSHEGICPVCGHSTTSLHNTYHRIVQACPLKQKSTYIDVIAYKYDCLNESCNRGVIMQDLPFVSASQRRTDNLNCLILAVSLFLSNEGASKVLKLLGINISNDSIKRLTDKIIIKDDPDVQTIGIDDVAIRKGQTYATAIYDMEDHHLIALLDGRNKESVVEWLKNHKKIKIATRDRASAYANAINEILPECIQIADRFHLLQNLIDRMKDVFKEEIPKEIFIKDGDILDEVPRKEATLKISLDSKELEKYNYDNSVPLDQDGNTIEFDGRCVDTNNKQYQKNEKNRKKNKN